MHQWGTKGGKVTQKSQGEEIKKRESSLMGREGEEEKEP